MNQKTKFRLLSVALMAVLACHTHAESHRIDLNTGSTFDGVVSTKPLCTVTQDADGITVSYQFDYALLSDDDNNAYTWNAEGLSLCTNPGEPAIMATRDIFNITDFKNVNVDITNMSYIDLPYELAPTPYPVSGSLVTPETEPIKPYAGFYPNEILRCSDGYNVRDGRYIDIDLCAIQYNYSTKTIRAYKSVTYRITPKSGSAMQQRAVNYSYEPQWLDEGMESIVANPQSNTTYLSESTSSDLGLLIVTSKELKSITEDYARYKRSLGIRTYVITLENGGNTPLNDVRALIQAQLAADKSISYMLIVGDTSHVPAYENKIFDSYHNKYIYHVTDLYYVAEKGDRKTVPTPSIKYGRIPFDTSSNIQTVFDKIKGYELTPPLNKSFYDNLFFLAHFSRRCEGTVRGYYKDSASLLADAVIEDSCYNFVRNTDSLYLKIESMYNKNVTRLYSLNNKYTDNIRFFDYSLPAPTKYYDGSPIPSELRDLKFYNRGDYVDIINAGTSCILYNSHGDVNCMTTGWSKSVTLDRLTNGDQLPVVLGIACQLGAYNKTTSVADTVTVENYTRSFLRQKNGGCVGMLASTNLSWVLTNNIFCNGLMDCIYPGVHNDSCIYYRVNNYKTISKDVPRSLRMGSVVDYGTKIVRANHSDVSMLTNHTETYHYFGDPTMRIRTKTPEAVDDPIISISGNRTSGYKLTMLSTNGQEYSLLYTAPKRLTDDAATRVTQPVRSLYGFIDYPLPSTDLVNYTICINGDNMIPLYRNLSPGDVESEISMRYNVTASYNKATNSIAVSFLPPTFYSKARVDIYDADGRYVGSTPAVKPNGFRYDYTINISSMNYRAPYMVCLMLDDKYVYSIKIQ